VTTSTRQIFPDRLRGIALLGIVLVNAPYLGISANGYTAESVQGQTDAIAAFAAIALAQSKFYLLFSFLFGYSSQFIMRTNSDADRRRFRRRLLALGVIGLIHATFLFVGDILVTYAVLGVGLLLLNGCSNRAVKRWAIGSAVSSVALAACFAAITVAIPTVITDDPPIANLDVAMHSGTFLDVASARLGALPSVWIVTLVLQGTMAFAAFCHGLLAARRQLLADPSAISWLRWAILGLAIGLPLQIVAALIEMNGISNSDAVLSTLGVLFGAATSPLLSAGYLASIGWLLSRYSGFLRFAQTPGRMSLSIYIAESIILSFLYCGYGLGYFGSWGAAWVLASGVATYIGLELLAKVWLSWKRQGPLEWLVAAWTRWDGIREASESPADAN